MARPASTGPGQTLPDPNATCTSDCAALDEGHNRSRMVPLLIEQPRSRGTPAPGEMRLAVHANLHARLEAKHSRVAQERFIRFDANLTFGPGDRTDVFGVQVRRCRVPARDGIARARLTADDALAKGRSLGDAGGHESAG